MSVAHELRCDLRHLCAAAPCAVASQSVVLVVLLLMVLITVSRPFKFMQRAHLRWQSDCDQCSLYRRVMWERTTRCLTVHLALHCCILINTILQLSTLPPPKEADRNDLYFLFALVRHL